MRIFVYMKKLTKLQMEEMIYLYTSGIEKNTSNLDRKYNLAKGSCYNNLKRRNLLKYSIKEYLLTLNQNYFNTIDTEDKAYFLGLIAADGHIYKNRNIISLSLCKEDGYDLLTEFLKKINSNTKINLYKDKRTDYKRKETCSIHLSSKILKESVIKLGILPDKTKNLKFPIIKNSLVKHFIRGFIDGDGCYYYRNNILYTSIVGTYDFLISLQKIINNNIQCNMTKLIKHKTGVYYLCYAHNDTKKLRNWLYENSTIYMKRKKEYVLNKTNKDSGYVNKIKKIR